MKVGARIVGGVRWSTMAPAACLRGFVVNENCHGNIKHGRLPSPVLVSVHHRLCHILDYCCSVRGNLHLDLDLTA
eukprot:6202756-Pleurochrysis_carterae.AAC.2